MKRVVLVVLAAGACLTAGYAVGRAQGKPVVSGIVSAGQTVVAASGDWGEFRRHYGGPTSGTADTLVGYADLKPGTENHPPHQHVEEEFLYLQEGSGTWTLGDKTYPAKAGDVLYSEPNVLHGLKNTSSQPLRFFVVKWRAR
jgi:mannose-6-phosphate isomerase-like protein (cupin superfamily)